MIEQIEYGLPLSHPFGRYTGCTQESEYLVYNFDDVKTTQPYMFFHMSRLNMSNLNGVNNENQVYFANSHRRLFNVFGM